jgi:hypothetical protein
LHDADVLLLAGFATPASDFTTAAATTDENIANVTSSRTVHLEEA